MGTLGFVLVFVVLFFVFLTVFLNARKHRRNRSSHFGNMFDFTKMPNTSIGQKKKQEEKK